MPDLEEVAVLPVTSETAATAVATAKSSSPSLVTVSTTGLIKLSELKSLLPHREYKIHGGQVSAFDSELSYVLCRQIDESLS